MLIKMLLKRIVPAVIGLAIVIIGAMWLYGYFGVKTGHIGPTQVPQLNAISHHGAEAAGGIGGAIKAKLTR